MSLGLTRMTGHAHAYYRKLLVAPLRKASVDALAADMARLAEAEVTSWPVGEIIDLWGHTRRLMQRLAVELLFGDTTGQGNLIAERVSRLMAAKWGLRPFAPINLPITSYGRMLREAELLERDLLEWARNKRGALDDGDLASIIVNSPDADGRPLDDAAIAGQMLSLFAAASEASQTVLTWTLVLLALHPRVARKLLDELRNKLGGAAPSLDTVGDLSYLDAVVKESMRIIPPVPMQMRVAQHDTTIAGHRAPNGTRVILNTFLTNRMPDLYPEGDVFRPDRWFTITPSTFEFPVFSGGPYSCPGYWFKWPWWRCSRAIGWLCHRAPASIIGCSRPCGRCKACASLCIVRTANSSRRRLQARFGTWSGFPKRAVCDLELNSM
jgi:cytochrome P450